MSDLFRTLKRRAMVSVEVILSHHLAMEMIRDYDRVNRALETARTQRDFLLRVRVTETSENSKEKFDEEIRQVLAGEK